jgi:hypothetical protein
MFIYMAMNAIFKLENKIEAVRLRMQELWNERGYTDDAVLITSIELDNLLNEYQRLCNQNSNYQK